jgi:hypothetical protein
MANEPLALSEILARLPDEADFDAACAALMATERGREFLAEYARRNRQADTQMVVSALARVEAAVRGEPAPQLLWRCQKLRQRSNGLGLGSPEAKRSTTSLRDRTHT